MNQNSNTGINPNENHKMEENTKYLLWVCDFKKSPSFVDLTIIEYLKNSTLKEEQINNLSPNNLLLQQKTLSTENWVLYDWQAKEEQQWFYYKKQY